MDTKFFDAVKGFKFTSRKHRISDEDAVDRVNSFYTPIILVIIASVIGTKMYLVGDPIQCWIPPEFHGQWEEFAENFCWVKNTYFVQPNASVPTDAMDRQKEELTYYQWVPFVLAMQALMFCLPSILWRLLNWQSGIQITDLVETALKSLEQAKDDREKTIELLARHIRLTVVEQRTRRRAGAVVMIKRFLFRVFLCGYTKTGNYLTMLYLLIKLLYVANVVGQFFLLNNFLGTDYAFYGVEILRDLIANRDWRHSGHFPRVTLCDFNIRVVGNMHPRTLQCVLVVNLFNEKAYIFLWFFFLIVAVLTIVDALAWTLWSFATQRRYASIKKYIKPEERGQRHYFQDFLADHLRADGAFVLRLMSKNAGDPIISDVVRRLWQQYQADKIAERDRQAEDNNYEDSTLQPDLPEKDPGLV